MLFDTILVIAIIAGLILAGWLNRKADSKRSFLEDKGGYEIDDFSQNDFLDDDF